MNTAGNTFSPNGSTWENAAICRKHVRSMESRIKINSKEKTWIRKKNTKFLKVELQDKIAMLLQDKIAMLLR
jgi:hypothetical protein